MAKIYYNKLLTGYNDGYTISSVPTRYQKDVKALADKDLKAGKLPKWQYDIMFEIEED